TAPIPPGHHKRDFPTPSGPIWGREVVVPKPPQQLVSLFLPAEENIGLAALKRPQTGIWNLRDHAAATATPLRKPFNTFSSKPLRKSQTCMFGNFKSMMSFSSDGASSTANGCNGVLRMAMI